MPITETIYSCKFMMDGGGCGYEGGKTPSASTGAVDKKTCLCIKTGDINNPGYGGNCDVGKQNIITKEAPKAKILPESIASQG